METYNKENPQITRFKERVRAGEEIRDKLKREKVPEPSLKQIAKIFFFALIKKIGYFCNRKTKKKER